MPPAPRLRSTTPRPFRRTPKSKPSSRSRPMPRRRESLCANVTPDPHAMTIRERTSFIELPPPGFTPRRFNPRAGYFPSSYRDYTAPLGDPLDQLFILRHRLIKKDPNCIAALRGRHAHPVLRRSWRAGAHSHRRWLKARAGGTRHFRQRDGQKEHFVSTCCRRAPTRWMCATTSFSGSTATRAAGAMAMPLPIRAPARSSKAM